MEYTELSEDEQKQILKQRAKQYEGEHFNHSVNKELLLATGNTDDATKDAIKAAEEAMSTLDDAYAATKDKLANLEKGAETSG